MKILWLTLESVLPANSGGRIGVFKRLEQVSKYNDIYLFYTYDDSTEEKYIDELKKYCKEVYAYNRKDQNVSTIIRSLVYPYTVASRKINKMQEDIKSCILTEGIEIINVDFPHMYINLKEVIKGYNIPVILNEHNIEWQVYRSISKSTNNILKKILYRFESYRLKNYENKIYKSGNIDLFTFVSENDMNYFEKWQSAINPKTALVPVGADLMPLNMNQKLNKYNVTKNLIFVGKMSYAPNIEAVIWFVNSIFPIILEHVPNVKFYIVGKDPTEEVMRLQSENIIVTGLVDSVESYYNIADLVVIPLLSGGGVKVKLLEAIGHGKYIVTTTKGIEGTLLEPKKHLCVSNNSNEFASYCIELLDCPQKYNNMHEEMLEVFRKKYTWDAIGKLYNQILNYIGSK